MKCKSCGKEVEENTKICPNCGFDIESFNKRVVVKLAEDPEVENSERASLIDSPILTFLFGILALLFSICFVVSETIVILYLALFILFNVLTFKFANKKCKVKLIPVRNVGKAFAYLSIGLVVYKLVYEILGVLFFS